MKRIKTMFALVLTLVLALNLGAFSATAFADEKYEPNAAITKIIEVPVGTTLPDPMSFEFTITPVSWDNEAYS